ncbi:DUF86 domain-containing protein [Candidatus Pacearchaeota archaeon]|nr:DUF86 domain-containing protein [Candidatus Pacearchaeota archaeon]
MNENKTPIKIREKRYKEKAELVEKRLSEIREWIAEDDEKTKLACYKAFQEIVEAIFDIVAMKIKDSDKIVEDDYKNTEKLVNVKIIDKKDAKILNEANGLRNRIIHKYNNIDDILAKKSIVEIMPHLKNVFKKLT